MLFRIYGPVEIVFPHLNKNQIHPKQDKTQILYLRVSLQILKKLLPRPCISMENHLMSARNFYCAENRIFYCPGSLNANARRLKIVLCLEYIQYVDSPCNKRLSCRIMPCASCEKRCLAYVLLFRTIGCQHSFALTLMNFSEFEHTQIQCICTIMYSFIKLRF